MSKYVSSNYALDVSKKPFSKGDVTDKEAINQSIESILMTGYRERVFEPNYGCFLMSIIFERLTTETAEELLDRIIQQIIQYEDRIKILSNQCKMEINRQQNSLGLTIRYIIVADGTSADFNRRIVF